MKKYKALEGYLSLASSDINNGNATINEMVDKIHYLMKNNGYKITKKTIKESFTWDKLEWYIKEQQEK